MFVSSSVVKNMFLVQNEGFPDRVVAQSEDGIIRILCPSNAKAITTNLPLLETDHIKSIAYSSKINRMYMMHESGEIWVAATNFNPCVVVDIWKDGLHKEECSCIVLFIGNYLPKQESHSNYDRTKGYVFLFGGTRNGQLILYGKEGTIEYRYQLHAGEITDLVTDYEQQILLSAGRVDPLNREIITVKVSILTTVIPCKINNIDNTICAVSEDFAIHMYSFILKTHDYKVIPVHIRSDDHTDTVTSLCSIPDLSVFVSSSLDRTLRVWDTFNSLIREIKFQHPIDSICVINFKGDLLISMQNRLDLMNYSRYLPPGYVLTVKNIEQKAEISENSIPFDESLDILNQILQQKIKKRPPREIFFDFFQEVNLITNENLQPLQNQSLAFADNTQIEEKEKILYEKLKELQSRRKAFMDTVKTSLPQPPDLKETLALKVEDDTKLDNDKEKVSVDSAKAITFESSNPESFENKKMEENFKAYLRFKKFETANEKTEEFEIPENWTPFSPLSRSTENLLSTVAQMKTDTQNNEPPIENEINLDLPAFETNEPGNKLPNSAEKLNEIDKVTDNTPEATKLPEPILPPTLKKLVRKHKELKVAPDGLVPNSLLYKSVEEWKNTHKSFKIGEKNMVFNNKKPKEEKIEKVDEGIKKKSDEYKARLKKMLEDKKKEEHEEEEVPPAPKEKEDDDSENKIEVTVVRSRLPPNKLHNVTFGMSTTLPEIKIPKIVERAMKYSWINDEMLFHLSPGENGSKKRYNRLKVIPDGNSMMKLTLDILQKSTDFKIRNEAIQYINWIYEEFGFSDKKSMVDYMVNYLQEGVINVELSNEEVEYRSSLMDMIDDFAMDNVTTIPALLVYLNSSCLKLKDKARARLSTLGLVSPESEHLTTALFNLYLSASKKASIPDAEAAKNPPETLTNVTSLSKKSLVSLDTNQAQIKKAPIPDWIKMQLKSQLIKSATDPAIVKKLNKWTGETSWGSQRSPQQSAKKESSRISKTVETRMSQPEREDPNKNDDQSGAAESNEPEPIKRNEIEIFKSPDISDLINCLNNFISNSEKRAAKAEAERLEKIAKEALEAEKIRKEMEKRAEAEALRQKKLAEMKAQKEARDARKNKRRENEQSETARIDKFPHIVSRAKTGHTHQSHCHESRETIQVDLSEYSPERLINF
ncbi:WD repeat-containing protein 87 [Nowakowskiella sp. JEL0407]|nr:WD repeat-containing protein 87 [Nowakowskiella sp. JEL0407]